MAAAVVAFEGQPPCVLSAELSRDREFDQFLRMPQTSLCSECGQRSALSACMGQAARP